MAVGVSKWKKNLPTWATLSRIFICIPILAFIHYDTPLTRLAAMVLYILAALTDWLDGYWARRYGVQSDFGKLMDPVADKIFVLSPLVMLVSLGRIDPLPVIILMARDSLVDGIRAIAAAERKVIAAKPLGKWKTGFQMVALPALILKDSFLFISSHDVGMVCLWMSVALSVLSGYDYVSSYRRAKGGN